MDNVFLDKILNYALTLGKNILISLIVLFVGRKVIKWLLKIVGKSMEKSRLEPMVVKFINSILKIALQVVLIVAVVAILGIPTTTFVTLLGTAGLTVGLALQGSLSNFAGGVLILIFKPFHVGDYIVACDCEGTVTGIDIFYTKLTTVDNKVVVIPNGTLANSCLTNASAEKVRRLDIKIGISYSSDIKKAKDVLNGILAECDALLQDRDVKIFVSSLDDSQITLETRIWVESSRYWETKWSLLEKYKLAFDENGIEIPFNQLSVTLRNS